jgi:peptide/nickel transport system substrate-binding protein
MKKNITLVALCLAVFLFLIECERQADHSKTSLSYNKNILRFDVAAPLSSLNPSEKQPSGSNTIFPLLYSFLCVPDENNRLQPDLATSWTYEPETFTWRIYLRTDARFHNGRPVASKDIIYSFERVLNNGLPSLKASIRKMSVLSESIFSFQLNINDPNFMRKIWDMEVIPGPDHGMIDYDNHPIGSGPFQFANRKGADEVVLSANPDYYNGRPSLDEVIFTYQPDKEKTWARLLAGDTDVAQEISPKNFEMMKQYEKQFYFNHYTLGYYSILLYNTKDPLFSDATVRRALTHAINRQYIVDTLLKGFAKIAIGPMGVDSPFHNPELQPLPYDPAKALELLHQAGWTSSLEYPYLNKNGQPFKFTVLILREYQIEKKIIRYIQLCLNDIGVKMDIVSLPYDEFANRFLLNKNFQAVLTEFTCASHRPEELKQLWGIDSSDKLGDSGFSDPRVTHLLDQALAETDPTKQNAYLYELDALIASFQPGTFLFQKTAIDVMSKRFILGSPFELTGTGIYRLKDVTLPQK